MNHQNSDLIKIGYSYLVEKYDLHVIPHHCLSYLAQSGRGSSQVAPHQTHVFYPKTYSLKEPKNPLQHLEFAIKYEGVNLEIITGCFLSLKADSVEDFVKSKPTGKYSRIIWFLYEFITGETLRLNDIKNVPYVDCLDPEKYYVATVEKSKRHAVNNNLLGNNGYCPFIRKTEKLREFENKNLSAESKKILKTVSPEILARATNYLYTKETKSSFGIEKVKPDVKRTSKFITMLESAANIPSLDKKVLIKLQNNIVDSAYRDVNYRNTQNYVGELMQSYMPKVHYISPKPNDIEVLMKDFLDCENTLFDAKIDSVLVATILAFGFVFLHPFEDGNGRIHRFIIHYVLSKTGFAPDNIVFPVSAVMLKNMREYDEVLEIFSKPLLQAIGNYDLSDDGELSVLHDSKIHYQYLDFTPFAEYLFACIELTIKEDFQEELDFIEKYDRTKLAIQEIVDMPDLKIDRIIRCVAENKGVLGKKMRRTYFSELSDEVIESIQIVVNKNM